MSISTRTPPPTTSRWSEAQANKAREQRRTRRIVFYVTASVIAALLIGIAVWEGVRAYKAHKHQQFINSIKDDPQKLHAAAEAGQITADEHEALRRDLGEERMNKLMDTYFAMSAADRAKWMLDHVKEEIERGKEWRARMASMGTDPTTMPWNRNRGNNNQNAQNQANNANSRTARYESRDPNRRDQMQQFQADRAAAYKQMGQEPPHGFGGGGRGR